MQMTLACVLIGCVSAAEAADWPRDPTAVLTSLADRIYVLGETSGKASDMVAAEEKAADEIRQFVATGSTDGLLAQEKGKRSALAAAVHRDVVLRSMDPAAAGRRAAAEASWSPERTILPSA